MIQSDSKERKIIGNIVKEQVIGQLSFFTGAMRVAQARAKTFTTILKISRDTFLNIIQENDQDYQQFHLMKDSILNYKNYELINIKCSVCNKQSHYTSDCPLVHFDKEEYYGKVRYYEKLQQHRGQIERSFSKNNTLKNSSIVYNQVKEYNQQCKIIQNEDEQNNSILSVEQDDILQDVLDKNNFPDYDKYLTKKNQTLLELDVYTENQLNQLDTPDGNNTKLNQTKIQNNMKANLDCDSPCISQKQQNDQLLRSETKNTPIFQEQNSLGGGDINQVKFSFLNINNSSLKNMDISIKPSLQKKRIEINNSNELVQNQQFEHKKSKLEFENEKNDLKSDNIWLFEAQKDYLIYFPEGNSKLVISRHNRISKLKHKQLLKKI